MGNFFQAIIEFFKKLRGSTGKSTSPIQQEDRQEGLPLKPQPASKENATTPEPPATREEPKPAPVELPKPPPSYPAMDVSIYRKRLKQEVAKKGPFPQGYEPIADDPTTKENERRTFCNFFVREVCSWEPFNWRGFESQDRDQAGEITNYMNSHPEFWEKLSSHEEAKEHALQGHLVVAGYVYPKPESVKPGDWQASGHVCIGVPEETRYSGKWKQKVCVIANVGSKNFYGKKLSWAFNPTQAPDLFVFRGRGATT